MIYLGVLVVVVVVSLYLAARQRDRCERALLLLYLGMREDWGNPLRKRIAAETGVTIPIHRIYPHLRDMEREGLLESWEVPASASDQRYADDVLPRVWYRPRRATASAGNA